MLSRFTTLTKTFKAFPIASLPAFQFATKVPKAPKKVNKAALVLSGSGVYDGSEITEAVSFLIAFGREKIAFECFAPNKEQAEVINHLTGVKLNESRNVLVESARIARGAVKDLKELKQENFDAVFFPGGFGAAKNLSDFAFEGIEMKVDNEVQRVLTDFHDNKKPIGLACISPIIAAKVFGGDGVTITLGQIAGEEWPYRGAIGAAEDLGAKHQPELVNSCCVDLNNLVFTTPAFMYETKNFAEIADGIHNLVKTVNKSLKKTRAKKAEEK